MGERRRVKRVNLKTAVINEISKKTERDKQVKVGPSDLGGCPRCVGRKMAGVPGDQDFSLYPWIGTAVHNYLEVTTFEEAHHELRVKVGEIPGYGEIWGTTDLLIVWEDGKATVLDWKIVGNKKLKDYRLNGVSKQYRYQIQQYARGCELAGYSVDSVAICFIPRDSGNPNDIWVYEEAYQPDMAEAVLTRAGQIYQHVQENGWEDIPADDECYFCSGKVW